MRDYGDKLRDTDPWKEDVPKFNFFVARISKIFLIAPAPIDNRWSLEPEDKK